MSFQARIAEEKVRYRDSMFFTWMCRFWYLVSNDGDFINFLQLVHLKLWLVTGQGLPEQGWHTLLREYNCWYFMSTVGRLDLFGILESKELGDVSGNLWNLRLRFGWHGWHVWLETARKRGSEMHGWGTWKQSEILFIKLFLHISLSC